jgi:hypothetical protein
MNMFIIEKGITPPATHKGRPKGWMRQLLETMEVGDSMLVPKTKIEHARSLRFVLNIKITTRKVDNETYRLWRVE